MIGAAAIEPLANYLADEDNPMYAHSTAASSLAEIGKAHPEERDRCVETIDAVLEKYETTDKGFNGFLTGDLVDLKAVEQIDLIKRAFEAEALDEFINGDVEDVQIQMGLADKKQKNQRKQEKKSRKKNRKRK